MIIANILSARMAYGMFYNKQINHKPCVMVNGLFADAWHPGTRWLNLLASLCQTSTVSSGTPAKAVLATI